MDLDWSPKLPRPKKNFAVFMMDESVTIFPKAVYEGEMGEPPFLFAVNVGYDPEDQEPYMYPYESQEVFFAYKRDKQSRALFQDSHQHTLSLPVNSPVLFKLGNEKKEEVTLNQIIASHALPVYVEFARPECMDFEVDGQPTNHTFFSRLLLKKVYEEPYLLCLSIEASGKVKEKPTVLPRYLKKVALAPIVSVKGAANSAAKIQEFIQKFTREAEQLSVTEDPFWQELAFVSRGPVTVDEVEPYIEQDTFIGIKYHRRPAPDAPEIPSVPLRVPLPPSDPVKPQDKGTSKKKISEHPDGYNGLINTPGDSGDHVYQVLNEPMTMKPLTQVVRPLPQRPKGDSPPPPLPKRNESSEDVSGSQDIKPKHRNFEPPPLVPAPRTAGGSHTAALNTLSVDDVAAKLKELRLEKYAKQFRKNRIDGVLLQKLTEHVLKTEFNMTQIEFLLLNTFVKEGHIPKKTNKKPGGTLTLPWKR